MRRQSWVLAVCLVSILASLPAVSAERVPVPGAPSCTSADQAAEPLFKTLCFIGPCSSVNDCWADCPTAATAACVNEFCQYTFGGGSGPGGGGPGGGGGPFCPSMPCIENWECVCGTQQGTCVNEFCVF